MKKYFSNSSNIVKACTVFAMILFMVAVAYYYLPVNRFGVMMNEWVKLCAYFFLIIPSLFVLIHGVAIKKTETILVAVEFFLLGALGFAAQVMRVSDILNVKYYFVLNMAYLFAVTFLFSYADKLAFKKNHFWLPILVFIIAGVPTISYYFIPQSNIALLDMMILITPIVYAVLFALALTLAIVFIIKSKNKSFWWAYSAYTTLAFIAYVSQILSWNTVYNTFLILAVVSAPYVLIYAVKSSSEYIETKLK